MIIRLGRLRISATLLPPIPNNPATALDREIADRRAKHLPVKPLLNQRRQMVINDLRKS